MKTEIQKDYIKIKEVMDGIRDSIKTETESLNYMTKIQNIQIDTKRKCSKPHYITENIKDEFCVQVQTSIIGGR